MVHANETLPLLVASWHWADVTVPVEAGLCLLPLGHSKSWCFLRAAPSTHPRAGAGVVWACHGFLEAQQCWLWEWLRGQLVFGSQVMLHPEQMWPHGL